MSNVRRGHDTERRCVRELKAKGYDVIRSAASKSVWDLIAIGSYDIKLIQCKRIADVKKNHASVRPKPVIDEMREAPAPKTGPITKELWTWVDRKGWTITTVI